MTTPTYTLLIVEDFPADRDLYRRALLDDSSCNYRSIEVESAAEGLEVCRTQQIDVILLDYGLPDADGLEFLTALSDLTNLTNSHFPPVVMLTGQGNESVAVRAIKLGAEDYLVKGDLTPELLQLTVRKAIDHSRWQGQLQQYQDRFGASIDTLSECIAIASEQERDRFFNLPLDLLAIGTFDGYFTRLNPAWEQTLGFTNAELMSQRFVDLVHPDDWERTEMAIRRGLNENWVSTDFENRYRCKDGSYRWLSWSTIVYPDRNLMYGIARDITERKRAEAALRSSEQKFSAIFEQSFELMGIVSLDGVLLEVNQAALDSIEAQKEDLVGQYFWDTPWWHTEQLQQQLKDAIERGIQGEFSRYEVQFPHPSGVNLTTDFSLKPVFDESDRVVMLVAEAHDITDRKHSQSDLEQRNQELDSFVHIVSHDLKAPLRAIANLSQWIEDDLDGSLPAASQEQLELLRARVHRMEATIDGLLDYARIGRTDGEIEQVDVAQLLAETIEILAPPPTFSIGIARNLPKLYTRRMLLSQVFANLIGNGIKHHDRVDGSLHIGINERRDCYEFAIADDGPGIDPVEHERVFRIFQAINPQKRSDSSGVGLAIVKKIVESEGGTLRLESQPGRGTTFYFTWPKRSTVGREV
jgi:PAS domain S-box-containing protein